MEMEEGMKSKRRGQKRRGRRRGRKGAVEPMVAASRVDSNPIEQGLYRAGRYPGFRCTGKNAFVTVPKMISPNALLTCFVVPDNSSLKRCIKGDRTWQGTVSMRPVLVPPIGHLLDFIGNRERRRQKLSALDIAVSDFLRKGTKRPS